MALKKKPQNHLENPQSALSSSEEESSTENEYSSAEEEEEHFQVKENRSIQHKDEEDDKEEEEEESSEDEDDDDEQGTESESESVLVKKLTLPTNYVEEGTPKKPGSKADNALASTSNKLPPVPAKSPTKRPAPPISSTSKQANRKKMKVAKKENDQTDDGDGDGDGAVEKFGDDGKKPLFQRYWSEEDEIAILQGMIDFTDKTGVKPSSNIDRFVEFMKKKLQSLDFERRKLMDKVCRLKKKYKNNLSKGRRKFSNPNDLKGFELSEKIWGIGGFDPDGTTKSRSLASLKEELLPPPKDGQPAAAAVPCFLGLEEFVVNKGFDMLKGAKRSELEEKWKELRRAELELFIKRLELMQEQVKLILESYNQSQS